MPPGSGAGLGAGAFEGKAEEEVWFLPALEEQHLVHHFQWTTSTLMTQKYLVSDAVMFLSAN